MKTTTHSDNELKPSNAQQRLDARKQHVPGKMRLTVWLDTSEILNLTGWCRQTLYAEIDAGRFPKPCKLTSRANKWRAEDYQAWSDAKATA